VDDLINVLIASIFWLAIVELVGIGWRTFLSGWSRFSFVLSQLTSFLSFFLFFFLSFFLSFVDWFDARLLAGRLILRQSI